MERSKRSLNVWSLKLNCFFDGWWLSFGLFDGWQLNFETIQSGRFTWITPETHLDACIVILIIIWPVWTRAPLFYMRVHPIWVETKISKPWTLSGKIFIDWVYLPGPSIQSTSTFYVIFSSFEVMLFAKIPIKLTTKDGMRTLRKKLIHTLATLGLPFDKKSPLFYYV